MTNTTNTTTTTTTTIRITIPAAPFVRVMRHVSDDASRPALTGVQIAPIPESRGGGATLCAVTPAHLRVTRVLYDQADDSAILPNTGITVIPGKVPARTDRIELSITGHDCVVRFLSDRNMEIGRALWETTDQPFPAWRTIFRHPGGRSPVQAVGINPAVFALFADATKSRTSNVPTCHFFGDEHHIVLTWAAFPDDIGLVMPCRVPQGQTQLTYPAFIGLI